MYYFRFTFSRVYNEGILSTTWLLHFRYEYIINDELPPRFIEVENNQNLYIIRKYY